jgi:pimeloyl-ACP methyl ester carboxylesterase
LPEGVIGGRRVAWRAGGSGEPALLLHCALAHSGAFGPLMARLGDRLAMRALDLPGHGGTDRDPARDIQDQAVEDALAMLAETGPAHLIGHSFGGTVALRLAAEAPGLVRGLTLIEPVMFAFLADAGDPAYEAEIALQASFHAAAGTGDWRTAADLFLARWGNAGGLASLPEAQAGYILARMPTIVASEPSILRREGRRLHLDDLRGLIMPVLLIEGAESPAVVGAILDAIATVLQQARRVSVPGAGHMLPVTHPDAVSDAIRDLLGGDEVEKAVDLGL